MEIAVIERGDLALEAAQVEEQAFLGGGRADLDQRPRAQDVFLDRGADPPHGVGREPEALVGLEALDRLHQPHIALRDHLGNGQAIAAIAHGDLGHEPQVGRDELLRRIRIGMFLIALGQHELLIGVEHRKFADFLQIAVEAAFGGKNR